MVTQGAGAGGSGVHRLGCYLALLEMPRECGTKSVCRSGDSLRRINKSSKSGEGVDAGWETSRAQKKENNPAQLVWFSS